MEFQYKLAFPKNDKKGKETLSHGQASVERGFNDNNVVNKDNMKSDSTITRRSVKNYTSSNELGPHTVSLTPPLLRSLK